MADNLVFRLKRGESGAVLTATLKSAGVAVNFTDENIETVHVVAKKNVSATAVLDEECAIDDSDGGIVSYAFDPTTSDIPVGEYLLEFRAVDNGGDEHYFPKGDAGKNYGKLRVTAPLS